MPRPSNASLSVVSVPGTVARLEPPPGLSPACRETFVRLTLELPPGHFRRGDEGILAEYCRALALADQAAKAIEAEGVVVMGEKSTRLNPWVTAQEKAQRAIVALGHKLRMSPHGRSPTNQNRPPGKQGPPRSYYDLWQAQQRDDAAD